MKLNFLDKLDTAIFKNVNPKHQAVSGIVFWDALIGGTIISLIAFVLQMCNIRNSTVDIVVAIGLLCLIAWVSKYAIWTLKAFSGWGGRIMYGIYLLLLCYLAFMIAMWMVMIALAGLLLYGIFKVFFSSGSSSSGGSRRSKQEVNPEDDYDYKLKDENGYERKLKDHGFGTFRDDKGDYWKRNGDGTMSRDNS